MHEYSIVSSLVDGVARAASPGATVRRVRVRIGELAGVDTELLATAYYTFRERTVCDEAELEIVAAPARWECPRCRGEIARGARLRCPACGVPARLAQGDEILLERIEMEVPDVH